MTGMAGMPVEIDWLDLERANGSGRREGASVVDSSSVSVSVEEVVDGA